MMQRVGYTQPGTKMPLLVGGQARNKKSISFGEGSMGIEVANVDQAPELLTVTKVTPGSQGQNQGVQVGDVVTGINGDSLPHQTSQNGFVQLVSAKPRPVVLDFNGNNPAVAPPTAAPALPPGWSALNDPNTGRAYYVNSTSGATQWDFPKLAL
jgi:hypothetical protein